MAGEKGATHPALSCRSPSPRRTTALAEWGRFASEPQAHVDHAASSGKRFAFDPQHG